MRRRRFIVLHGGPFSGKAYSLELNEAGEPPEWLHCPAAMPHDQPVLPQAKLEEMADNVVVYKRHWNDRGGQGGGFWRYVFTEPTEAIGASQLAD